MRSASGAEKAALVLLALGEQHGAPIWSELDDEDVAAVTAAMAKLGNVPPEIVHAALDTFRGAFQTGAGLIGNRTATEKLLASVLPEERSAPVLDKLRRPSGPDVWERLSGLKDQVLADYLAGEYPQTAAVILSRLPSAHAARVLAKLPQDFALLCLDRVMKLESVDRDMLRSIEATLGESLIAPQAKAGTSEPASRIADIFNSLDRQTSATLLDRWRETDADGAGKIRSLMFTFEDFAKLGPAAGQTLLRVVDKDQLALALKAATPDVRSFFMDQMSGRAARLFEDQMSSLGPVRLRDAEDAQAKIIGIAKELAGKGEIVLATGNDDAEMVE